MKRLSASDSAALAKAIRYPFYSNRYEGPTMPMDQALASGSYADPIAHSHA